MDNSRNSQKLAFNVKFKKNLIKKFNILGSQVFGYIFF